MARSFKKSMVVDVSPDTLLTVLTNEEFHLAHEATRDDAIDATFHDLIHTEDRHVFEVRANKYGRRVTGGVDKSKREKSVMHSDWDLRARTCEWTVETRHGELAKVGGSNVIEPAGDGSKLTTEYHVSVTVRVIGPAIDYMVMSAIEKHQPIFEGLVRRYCDKMRPRD